MKTSVCQTVSCSDIKKDNSDYPEELNLVIITPAVFLLWKIPFGVDGVSLYSAPFQSDHFHYFQEPLNYQLDSSYAKCNNSITPAVLVLASEVCQKTLENKRPHADLGVQLTGQGESGGSV